MSECSWCGDEITGKGVRFKGMLFCSEECRDEWEDDMESNEEGEFDEEFDEDFEEDEEIDYSEEEENDKY
jgi:hypothetical protein